MPYTAPVSNQRLILNAVAGIGELAGGPDAETVDAVLEGAAALAEGEFAPLLRVGGYRRSALGQWRRHHARGVQERVAGICR